MGGPSTPGAATAAIRVDVSLGTRDGSREGARGGGTVAQTHLRMGKAAAEIVELAEELGAGLVVVGSRGLAGISRALMGSVSDSVSVMPTAPS